MPFGIFKGMFTIEALLFIYTINSITRNYQGKIYFLLFPWVSV